MLARRLTNAAKQRGARGKPDRQIPAHDGDGKRYSHGHGKGDVGLLEVQLPGNRQAKLCAQDEVGSIRRRVGGQDRREPSHFYVIIATKKYPQGAIGGQLHVG